MYNKKKFNSILDMFCDFINLFFFLISRGYLKLVLAGLFNYTVYLHSKYDYTKKGYFN